MADGTQSIGRAIQILKAFDDENPTRDLTQLVEVTGLNKTTVHRILNALEQEGLIERTDDNGYCLGSELIAMGGRAARANNLREASYSHIRALSRITGETTTLEIIRRENNITFTLVIDEVLGKHLVGINQYIGTKLPIHATSTGKAILAYLPDDAINDLQTPELRQYTVATVTSYENLNAELRKIRSTGYSLVMGELEEGLVAIGAPVFNHNAEPVAAISLVGPSVRINREKAVALSADVMSTAASISYAIGYREPETV